MQKLRRRRSERGVLARKPGARAVLVAPEGVEGAEETHEQQRQFPFLGPFARKRVLTCEKTRRGGFGDAENTGYASLRKSQEPRRPHHRLAENGRLVSGARCACHRGCRGWHGSVCFL